MAIDTMKIEEVEKMKKIQDRLDDVDKRVDVIFAGYTIPGDITDSKDKLNYVLVEIGDDQDKRKKLKEDFAKIQEENKLSNESIAEDFINMRDLGDKRIEKYAEKIKALEEEFEKQKLAVEDKTKVIEALDADIKEIEAEKAQIQGADGKGGKIAEEKAKSAEAKNAASELARRIIEIDKEIAKIDARIEELNELNRNTTDPDELKKNAAEIASLQGNKTTLMNERQDVSKQQQDKKAEQRECEDNITNLQGQVINLDSEINSKSTSKNTLENELRLMPEVGNELEKTKEEFNKQRVEYNKTVEDMEKSLKEKGIQVKSREEIAKENTKKEKANDENKEENKEEKKEQKNENKEENKQSSKGSQSGPVNNGEYIPNQEEAHPVITEQDKKQANYDFITGYSGNDLGLTSEKRMERIRSELCGRDYEAMTRAFKELQNSPIKLTKEEKKEIKNIMQTDKMNIAKNIKDIDADKLTDLFNSVGITLSKSELKSLNFNSYDDGDRNSEDYGSANFGILDGFSKMSQSSKSKWEEAVMAYSKNKKDMTPEQVEDFERYVMTPVKFGTLQEQAKQLYSNPLTKAFSNLAERLRGGSRVVDDIRSAIAKSELPEGVNSNAENNHNDFTNDLRNQTQTPPHRDSEKNPPETDDYII